MIKSIKPHSQNATLLLHLAKGRPITRYKAILMFRVQNFTGRMSELRRFVNTLSIFGYKHSSPGGGYIEMKIKTDPNGQTFAEYRINCRGCRQAVGRYLQTLRRKPRGKYVKAA